ncbi:MAG: glycosyltransferase family 2 protein [Chitinophagaceae bacterium]
MSPAISVILPVYNAASFLNEAIDSLLSQTFTDFELLIYDDGSTDNSRSIIDTYQDSRIVRHYSDTNEGLIAVLNKGLSEAKGKYIARMDADDICLPSRFKLQFEFMESHPELGISGTQLKLIHNNEPLTRPTTDSALRWWFFRGSPFAHPSVILRTSLIREHQLSFNRKAYVAEDYDLWWKMAFFCKMANLSEVLVLYRIHPSQESSAKSDQQSESHNKSLLDFMNVIGLDEHQFSIHFIQSLLSRELESNYLNIAKSLLLFSTLLSNEKACEFFGKEELKIERNNHLKYLVQTIKKFEWSGIKLLREPVFQEALRISGVKEINFMIKCLIGWKTR